MDLAENELQQNRGCWFLCETGIKLALRQLTACLYVTVTTLSKNIQRAVGGMMVSIYVRLVFFHSTRCGRTNVRVQKSALATRPPVDVGAKSIRRKNIQRAVGGTPCRRQAYDWPYHREGNRQTRTIGPQIAGGQGCQRARRPPAHAALYPAAEARRDTGQTSDGSTHGITAAKTRETTDTREGFRRPSNIDRSAKR
jgi:ribosomal protein L34E